MRVVHEYPPNFDEIVRAFPAAIKRGVVFTYGHDIYAPTVAGIPEDILVHEMVHCDQQTDDDSRIREWWRRYLVDTGFRFSQELEAHRAEYRWYQSASRNRRRIALRDIAAKLASPLYGSMITEAEARRQLK